MRLLLDTNVVLWFLERNSRLLPSTLAAIETAPEVLVSTVCVWEIAIKQGKGKLTIVPDFVDYIYGGGFLELKPSFIHALRAGGLPPLHADPFDRMLVAQALCEDMTLVTADRQLAGYGAKLLMAA